MYRTEKNTLWALFSWITWIVCVTVAASAPLTPRHVGLSFVRSDEGVRLEVPPGAKLSVQERRIKPGESLEALLLANGILANQDAFRLVYDLNPEVSDLKTSTLPATLNLPKVVLPDGKGSLLKQKGYLVRLSVDEELKKQTIEAIARLEQQAGRLPQDSEAPVLQPAALRSLQTTTQILSVVKRSLEQGSQPVGSSLLQQIQDEAGFTADLLTKASSAKIPLTPDEVEFLKAVEDDVIAKAPTFDETRGAGEPPKRWREVTVRVKVLSSGAGQEVQQLRVSYAPVALLGRKQYPFGRLTPNAVERIPEGNYYIWAAIYGKPEPVTPSAGPLKIRVPDNGGEQAVDLLMNH